MIEFVFKFVAGSTIFIVLYFALLQYVKSFRINRWYLLSSLLLALLIPFFVFEVEAPVEKYVELPTYEHVQTLSEEPIALAASSSASSSSTMAGAALVEPSENNSWGGYLFVGVILLYFVGAIAMAIRFNRNLRKLYLKIVHAETVRRDDVTIILINDQVSPFSFFKYLFVNREEYFDGLAQDIVDHERAHIEQNHTWDIIFIEILLIVFWFNPALYFYKRAIQTNHEFLADEAVVSTRNHFDYLALLLQSVSQRQVVTLVSPFNHSLIKKRLLMITKKRSALQTNAFQLLAIMVLIGTIALFSKRTYAQAEKDTLRNTNLSSVTNSLIGLDTLGPDSTLCADSLIPHPPTAPTSPTALENDSLPLDMVVAMDSLKLDMDLSFLSSPEFMKSVVSTEDIGRMVSDVMASTNFTEDIQKIVDGAVKSGQQNPDSPEFKAMIKRIEKNAKAIEKKFNSPEFKANIAKIEANAAKIEEHYNSPEFKAKIAKIEADAAEIEKRYNSPEFKAKIAKIEREAEERGERAAEIAERKAERAERDAERRADRAEREAERAAERAERAAERAMEKKEKSNDKW